MAVFNKFQQFVEDKNHGVHNFNAHQLRVALTNTAPTSTLETLSQIVQIDYTNIAENRNITTATSAQTSGIYKLTVNDLTLNATGTVPNFRYVVIYNDTPTAPADPLIGWYDYGSTISLLNGESLTLDFDQVNGLFTDQ